MRPGPGLVVMALAFISGARRASTTNINTNTNTISSSGSGSSSSSLTITIPTATATPAITTTTTTRTRTTLPSSYDSATSGSRAGGGGGGFSFLLSTLGDGSPGYVAPARDSFELNFDFYPHSRVPDEQLPAFSTRHARSLEAGSSSSSSRGTSDEARGRVVGAGTESAAGAPESSEATLISENENEETETDREERQQQLDEQEQEQEQDDNRGLPVQYASSRAAFDEDLEADTDAVADEDIFALVAEDDLLSEESFDRLIKLSEDADNAAAAAVEEDEDYNLAASLALTRQQQQREHEPEPEQQDESRLIDESLLHAKHIENERETADSNNNKRETREQQEDRAQKQEEIRVNDAYASHLIAIAQRDGGTLPSALATAAATTASGSSNVAAPVVDLRKSILGTATALTRLNPWISACDLAQPGITGTDLQGQCSAGTLPMAWVDEGPGPPICPRSCAEQQPTDSSAEARTDNKLKYFINANTINYKSPHTRLSHSNSNSNNNYKAMSRVRRDRQWEMQDVVANAPTEPAVAAAAAAATTEQDGLPESSTLSATASSNDVDELEDQSMPTLLYSHLQTQEQHSANEQQQQQQQQKQQQPPQQQQQQCLDYLGDAAETSPQHLCGLRSPGQLLARLRTLRLRHCCERSVFSALHTLALNATLSDRNDCIRLLSDLLDVDALANRITCELAEILFRFDCRQVYSLVNQCDDCKEAYRRWVCSTLVPYYAEPQDVDATPADDLAARGAASAPKPAAAASKTVGGTADGTGGIKHKSQKLISNNNKSNNGNNMNERQINQQHDENNVPHHNEPQNKNPNASANRNVANVAQAFYDAVGIGQHQSPIQTQNQFHSQFHVNAQPHSSNSNSNRNNNSRGASAQQQFNNFISTANNADPSAADPVISKLQKRSTRKAEFRKRRRIRPCLSVCQTVEQKCPYLLPADRAPALPTQYAGEPTFVCLDQNIPETGEQLKKSSYGPNDCCYSYCNGPIDGICTICQEFATTAAGNSSSNNSSSTGRRVHNITLTMSSPPGEHARAASVSVALRNVSQALTAGAELLERLPYYARHDSVYYYDDDEGSDMPELALSGGCAPVPSVSTRCEIPYFASGVAPSPPTQLLVFLSALLGLLSSCGAARQRCGRTRNTTARVDCPASCHELLASSSSSPRPNPSSSQSHRAQQGADSWRDSSGSGSGSGNGIASYTASQRPEQEQDRANRNARNYRYFYYYNYNINDWWRRWKWLVGSAATIISNGAL
ncbi:GH21564 [Drosophila grimshawi]|uniref:GH21564 n=1 Tax=Drosophila grimshawi TaxID=7222 RepID=B4J4I1_DROGR|nr:GH21564 [Drosophila grimshawi]